MRIIDLDAIGRRSVDRFGSVGFSVGGLGTGDGTHHAVVALDAGGIIGRHPTVGHQLLVLLSGDAIVAGADALAVPLAPGQAALWEPGEEHETRSRQGMRALVIEGGLRLPPAS